MVEVLRNRAGSWPGDRSDARSVSIPGVGLLGESFVQGYFDQFHYLAPFTVLLLCGIGLPLPEEVTLLGSGLLVYQGKVDFTVICVVCSVAILLGDSIPYLLGRRYGMRALRFRWVRRVLHPERFQVLQQRFEEHGNWAIFTCRFLPGVRIPGYFVAGTLGMRLPRFLLLDALGVVVSVPISIYLGKLFGEHVDDLRRRVENFHQILAFAVLSLVVILFVMARSRRRDRTSTPEADAPAGGGETGGDEPPA